MRKISLIAPCLFFLSLTCCAGESARSSTNAISDREIVGGGCDGCELMFEGMPAEIMSVDTSPGWLGQGQKMLISGTVFQQNGKTPAPDIVIYYWQTDHQGYYAADPVTGKKPTRHGYIRGWVKTDAQGKYAIYTIRPAPYPDLSMAAHIHTSIKEPQLENEYYIDEFVFDDDELLNGDKRAKLENRGGSGILHVQLIDGILVAKHDIILGLNIPYYPKSVD